MPGNPLLKDAMRSKVGLFVGFGLLLTLVAGLLLAYEISSRHRPTRELAELYLSAILDGDRQRALGLIRLEVLCSGAGMEQEVDKQLAMFASAEVREVAITVEDLTGSVAYNPGTEGADIQFEYKRPGDPEWRTGLMGIAAFDYAYRWFDHRAVCWLWTAEE